ncbi:MAG: RNA polymerase sigma factor [Vicinamibacteraceae bacterium]
MSNAESELLEQLLAGDESAFERLVNQYHDRLRRLARVYVRTDALAEDVVQETWLAVLRGLHQFERRSALRTWNFNILANRARTHAVREGRLMPFSDLELRAGHTPDASETSWFDAHGRWREPPAPWSSNDPETLALRQEVQQALDATIDTLPPGQRAVIILRDIEGVPAHEACNILEISETNQRVLLHRGRTRIRRALAALLERR